MKVNILRRISAILLALILFVAYSVQADNKTSAAQISVEDFVQLPEGKNVKISPDGKHMSVVFKIDGEYMLLILDAATHKSIGSYKVKGEGRSIGRVYWVNNQRLIYSVNRSYAWDKQVFENGELFGLNIDGESHKIIFGLRSNKRRAGRAGSKEKLQENGDSEIIDLLPDDDRHILLAFYPWRTKANKWVMNRSVSPKVYKLNVYNGNKRQLDTLPMPLATGITDNQGNVRFAIGVNEKNREVLWYKNTPEDKWQRWSTKGFEGKRRRPVSFTADNKKVYVMANEGTGTRALYLLNLKDKSVDKLAHDKQVDVSDWLYDFSNNKIIAVSTDLGQPEYDYIEPDDPKSQLHKTLRANFKGFDVIITSASKDKQKVIVYVYSDTHPGAYFLYRRATKKFEFVMARRPWINHQLMSPSQPVNFKTRDGATIYGYLTKPLGTDKNQPMVVLPHGGPHGVRDTWGFDWVVQLLASRGYAVLQVNYRGSDGFGIDYEEIGKGKWGTLMQDDLTDATKAMITQGVADPSRICMYGTSYGGYAALMGAVREPDLYRCVIGSAGVYNLPMMYEQGDIQRRESGLAYLREALGEDPGDLKRRSPAFNADKIKAQVLLIHGSRDERAPIEQAESLMAAFDKIDKKYQWLEVGNESHGYYDETNRLKVYNRILAFLDQYIGSEP